MAEDNCIVGVCIGIGAAANYVANQSGITRYRINTADPRVRRLPDLFTVKELDIAIRSCPPPIDIPPFDALLLVLETAAGLNSTECFSCPDRGSYSCHMWGNDEL